MHFYRVSIKTVTVKLIIALKLQGNFMQATGYGHNTHTNHHQNRKQDLQINAMPLWGI